MLYKFHPALEFARVKVLQVPSWLLRLFLKMQFCIAICAQRSEIKNLPFHRENAVSGIGSFWEKDGCEGARLWL